MIITPKMRVLVHQAGFPQYGCMGTVLRPTKLHTEWCRQRNMPDWHIVKFDDGRSGCYHASWLHGG